jgi:hypothetical protein
VQDLPVRADTYGENAMGVASLVPKPDADHEVERLRVLIERQPTCVLRVALDGVILAANDAALGQLGASQLGQALGHRFTQWMLPGHRDRWLDLARRAYANGAASIECELLDLAERRHAVQLQAVKQPPHPDGMESMTVAVREISGMSRLEQALQDQEAAGLALADARERLEAHGKARAVGSEERARLQRELDEARAEIAGLAARLAEHEAERRRERARHAEERAQLDTLLAGAARSVTMAREMVRSAPERLGPAGGVSE